MKRNILNILLITLIAFRLGSCTTEEQDLGQNGDDQQQSENIIDNSLLFDTQAASFQGSELRKDFELASTDYISIPFTNELANAYVVEVSNVSLPQGLSMDMYALVQNQPYGNLSLSVEGTPELAFDTVMCFSLTANDRQWDFKVLASSGDDLQASTEFEISSITFNGPIFASSHSNFAENYNISLKYINGSEGSELKLTNISGYLVPDAEKLAALEPISISEGSSSAVIDLGANFYQSMVNPDNIGEAANDAVAVITMSFEYNSTAIDDKTVSINPGGYFIWNNFTYGVYYDGNQTWLDRNLGAISSDVSTPTLEGNTISDWNANYNSYGSYFQRGRSVGIPIMQSGNTISGSNSTDPYFYYNANSSWEQGSWEAMPAELDSASDQSLWNASSDGGTNNPCPTGFRVPSTAEIISMVEYVADISTTSNAYEQNNVVIPALTSTMNLPLSGYIQHSGPTMVDQSSSSCGQINAVGFNYLGSGTEPGEIISASEGAIYLLTCDNGSGNALNCYVKVSSSGQISTGTLNKSCCLPVRCILVR